MIVILILKVRLIAIASLFDLVKLCLDRLLKDKIMAILTKRMTA
jgi:hypothetical protein